MILNSCDKSDGKERYVVPYASVKSTLCMRNLLSREELRRMKGASRWDLKAILTSRENMRKLQIRSSNEQDKL